MAIIIKTFICCDKCGLEYGLNKLSFYGYAIRKDARSDGWLFSGNIDYCPDCRPKRKDRQNHKSGVRKYKKLL